MKITTGKSSLFLPIFIFFLALTMRLVYISQLSHTYFFKPFEGGFDDYMFDSWAREILKGNWTEGSSLYIYRMPLYGYFLAFVYYLFGHSFWALYIIQSLIGASVCVLVYLIGKMLFDEKVGMVAGAISALYGIFLYYNGFVVGETLAVFFICLAFIFLLLFQRSQGKAALFMGGVFMGLSILTRGGMMAVFPFILFWIGGIFWRSSRTKAVFSVFVFVLGAILAIAPIMVRNYIKEKDIVPVTAQGGLTFYIGNAYGADGKYHNIERLGTNQKQMLVNSIAIAENAVGRKLKPSEVSKYWFYETLKSIRDNGVTFIFPLTLKKFIMFWNSYELPDIWDYYFFKGYIPLLRLPLVGFSFVIPLAFAGIYMARIETRKLSLLYIFVFGYMLSLTLSFVTSRYRMGIIPFLIVLASYAIVEVIGRFKENKAKLAVCVFISATALVFTNINIGKLSFETSHNSLGILLKRDGRIEEAIKEYNRAIDIAPNYPSPYYNLGILYRDQGERDKAISYFKKALECDPYFTKAQGRLEELLR